jgi:hypothetical protein
MWEISGNAGNFRKCRKFPVFPECVRLGLCLCLLIANLFFFTMLYMMQKILIKDDTAIAVGMN